LDNNFGGIQPSSVPIFKRANNNALSVPEVKPTMMQSRGCRWQSNFSGNFCLLLENYSQATKFLVEDLAGPWPM